MAFSITNWNVSENREWFVRLYDTGSATGVQFFHSQADAESETNVVDSGTASYGVGQDCTLTGDTEFFQADYDWHLQVTGSGGDATKIFRVREFVELDEILHSIYRTSALVEARATYEINMHTHATMKRDLPLAQHLPELEIGDIMRLDSTRRGVNDLSQVISHTITGEKDSLTTHIETVKFVEVTR